MTRPTTLPEEWRALVDAAGGVRALALSIGVSPRAITGYGSGAHRPMPLVRLRIEQWCRRRGLATPFVCLALLVVLVAGAGGCSSVVSGNATGLAADMACNACLVGSCCAYASACTSAGCTAFAQCFLNCDAGGDGDAGGACARACVPTGVAFADWWPASQYASCLDTSCGGC